MWLAGVGQHQRCHRSRRPLGASGQVPCYLPAPHGPTVPPHGPPHAPHTAPPHALCVILGLQVFIESSLPVIQHYEREGRVARINADRDAAQIYTEVRRLFLEL